MDWPFITSDEQAMWRVQHHDDHAAFAKLWARWESPVHRLCTRMIGDAHRAQDITQEAFTRVFSNRHRFDATGKFSTWLWRITLNLCYDELRRRIRHPESEWTDNQAENPTELETANPNPADSLAAAERQDAVRQALQQLAEPYRTVVILRHYENLKFSEIALVLGVPEGTVKSRMAEGLNRLARRLKPLHEPGHNQNPNPNLSNPSSPQTMDKTIRATSHSTVQAAVTSHFHPNPLLPS